MDNNNSDIEFRILFAAINTDAFITGTRNLQGIDYIDSIKFMNDFLNDKTHGAPALLPPEVLKEQETSFKHLQKKLDSMVFAAREIKAIPDFLKQALSPFSQFHYQSHTTPEEIEKKIDTVLKQKLAALSQRVETLQAKPQGKQPDSVLMPGGWKGKPGHAIAYEFQKDEAGNLLFLVYNTGAGIQFHEKIISAEDNKERYKTVKCFKIPAQNISKENLSYFISELVKPRVLPFIDDTVRKKTKEIKYSADVVYHQVFTKIAELGGEEIPVSELGETYNSIVSIGQRAGTCAEKSLHQLIKNDVPDKKTAKLILFCLKLRSIEMCLGKIKVLAPESIGHETYLAQLEPAIENLSRILLKKKIFQKISKIKHVNI